MCGIAGFARLDGKNLPESSLISAKKMTDAMKWRGPDDEGQWLSGSCCLSHRRLSIIDLAGGQQPMLNYAKTLAIVFNGEIYNYKELAKKLADNGAIIKTSSDTEVILAAYETYGTDCLEYLEGMFAFALWDAKKKRLFCARDHFGKKPFFYTVQDGIFIFSSELSSIEILKKENPSIKLSLDPMSICRYLAYEYIPAPKTAYKEVKTLPPAHSLVLENSQISIQKYWELPFPDNTLAASENELCEELRRLMTRATKLRMISDVPLGVFLSGGIDSTIVAGLMSEIASEPIKTFSIGFQEASYDESQYARIAANAFHSIHHEKILSAEDCADVLPKIVSKMDVPMADASCAPTWLLSSLAREKVTVCLGGDGSDEFWAGYEHYIGYKIAGAYNKLPKWLRTSIIPKIIRLLPESSGYINPRLACETFLKGANAPDWLRVQTLLTAFGPDMQKEILNPDWLNSYGNDLIEQNTLFEPTFLQYNQWQPENAAAPLDRAFYVYIRQYMLDDILVKVDRCSMLNSLEVRSPFLDKKVTEFVARLPQNYKLRGFKRKYLLKKAFASLLPPKILKRNKRGFQIPVSDWLRGKLKPLLLDMFDHAKIKQQGIFNADVIQNLMKKHFSGKEDLRKQLWTLLVFQLWLKSRKHATF